MELYVKYEGMPAKAYDEAVEIIAGLGTAALMDAETVTAGLLAEKKDKAFLKACSRSGKPANRTEFAYLNRVVTDFLGYAKEHIRGLVQYRMSQNPEMIRQFQALNQELNQG